MKRLLTILLFLFSLSAAAQVPAYFTPVTTPYAWKWGKFDYVRPPLAPTTGAEAGSFYYNAPDSSYYGWTGFQYLKVGGAGGGGTTYSAGWGLALSGSSFRVDSLLVQTRLRAQKQVDSILSVLSENYYTKVAADARFAPLSHNHTASQITDLTTQVRNLFSAGTGIAYNAATGVISATGGGGGAVSSVFGRTGDVLAASGDYGAYYAPLSHVHSAATDITTGTLPIARGGTGLSSIGTTGQSLRVNAAGTGLEYFTPGAGGSTYTFSAPMSEAGGTVSMTQAGGSTNGYLSAVDWNSFNSKVSPATLKDSTDALRALIAAGGGTPSFEQTLIQNNTLTNHRSILLGISDLRIYGTYNEFKLGQAETVLQNWATGGALKLGTYNGTVTIEALETGAELDLEFKNLPAATGSNETGLVIDNTTGEVRKGAGATVTTTTSLTDVSDAAPTNNSTLVYNGDSAKYVPTQAAQYNLTSPQNGDLLKYQDGQWVNFTPNYGTGSSSYDSIAVTGTTDKAGLDFNPVDTSLNVTYGGVTFHFKQSGGGGTTGGTVYETESDAYFTRVAAAGGALSTAHKNAINTYIKGLKDNGLYAKFTELWLFVGGNAAAHALGIKNAHNLAFTGTWLHAATGITGDGVTSYANTGVIPSAHMSLNDQHLSIWSRTNAALAGTTTDFGARNGAPNYEANVLTAGYGDPHYFATAQLGELPDPGNPQYTYATTQGWWLASRTSSANSVLYRNGSSVATGSLASSAQATVPLYLGAMNQSGTGPSVVSNREYAFASAGQGLSASEAATVYSLLNTLMTALGR